MVGEEGVGISGTASNVTQNENIKNDLVALKYATGLGCHFGQTAPSAMKEGQQK